MDNSQSHFNHNQNSGEDNGVGEKKLFQFVVDVSGSMYRFNGRDHRLERMLEAVLLVLETFPNNGDGTQTPAPSVHTDVTSNELNIDYCITGHSGSDRDVPFVDFNVLKPANEAERFKILETMVAHTQFCDSGDNTLEAVQWAVSNMEQQANLLQSAAGSGGDGGKDDKFILAVRYVLCMCACNCAVCMYVCCDNMYW